MPWKLQPLLFLPGKRLRRREHLSMCRWLYQNHPTQALVEDSEASGWTSCSCVDAPGDRCGKRGIKGWRTIEHPKDTGATHLPQGSHRLGFHKDSWSQCPPHYAGVNLSTGQTPWVYLERWETEIRQVLQDEAINLGGWGSVQGWPPSALPFQASSSPSTFRNSLSWLSCRLHPLAWHRSSRCMEFSNRVNSHIAFSVA